MLSYFRKTLHCIGFYTILLSLLTSCSLLPSLSDKEKENRELAELHRRIGTGYLTKGNLPLATKELRKAEELDPNSVGILNNLGLAYFLRDKKELAIQKFQKAIEINPQYTEARNNLARVYLEQENYNLAIQHLKISTADLVYRFPEKSWTNLGLAYSKSNQLSLAKQAFEKAIALNRNYCPAFTLLGKNYYQQNDFTKAAFILDQAVFKCSKQNYDEPNYYSGLSYLKLGKKEEAKSRMMDILQKFPDGPYAFKAQSVLQSLQTRPKK